MGRGSFIYCICGVFFFIVGGFWKLFDFRERKIFEFLKFGRLEVSIGFVFFFGRVSFSYFRSREILVWKLLGVVGEGFRGNLNF